MTNTTFGNSDKQLSDAISDMNLDKIIKSLDNGANPNTENIWWNGKFTTPLIAAIKAFKSASQSDKEKVLTIIDILFIAGANPNLPATINGKTPLIVAAQNNHLEIVETLLQKGADPNLPNTHSRKTPLIVAAQNGHYKIVYKLLEQKNININAQDAKSRTALIIAVQNNHLYTTKILLKIGKADPNVQNKQNGKTALIIAAENNHPEIVEFLLNEGANPHIQDKNDKTAFTITTENSVIDMRVFSALKNATEKSCTEALS